MYHFVNLVWIEHNIKANKRTNKQPFLFIYFYHICSAHLHCPQPERRGDLNVPLLRETFSLGAVSLGRDGEKVHRWQ